MGWNFVRILALVPMALAIGAMSASAAPIMIDFENDFPTSIAFPEGCRSADWFVCSIEGNNFTSEDSTLVHFRDTAPQSPGQGGMAIVNTLLTSNTDTANLQALAVGVNGDSAALEIIFELPAVSIGMDFLAQDGGMAVLTAFQGTAVVAATSADLADEEIFFDCILFDCGGFDSFDSVKIAFVGSLPDGLTEIVDNVSVTLMLIPEPHAAVVFGVGALLVGAACARRGGA